MYRQVANVIIVVKICISRPHVTSPPSTAMPPPKSPASLLLNCTARRNLEAHITTTKVAFCFSVKMNGTYDSRGKQIHTDRHPDPGWYLAEGHCFAGQRGDKIMVPPFDAAQFDIFLHMLQRSDSIASKCAQAPLESGITALLEQYCPR